MPKPNPPRGSRADLLQELGFISARLNGLARDARVEADPTAADLRGLLARLNGALTPVLDATRGERLAVAS